MLLICVFVLLCVEEEGRKEGRKRQEKEKEELKISKDEHQRHSTSKSQRIHENSLCIGNKTENNMSKQMSRL